MNECCICCDAHSQIKDYTEATATKEQLLALIHICQSMHAIFPLADDAANNMVSCELNPCNFVCTCKGFRMSAICSHCIAVTVMHKDGYNEAYIDELLKKLSEKKKASHRPNKTAGGAHMQPHGDSSDDEEDNFVDDNGDWNDAFDVDLDEY